MTPEDEVEAAMAAAEATHSGIDPELVASFAEYVANATAYQVYRGVRKAKEIAKLMIEEYGLDHFKQYMRRPFRGAYNQVRSRFEDEPWVDEMTPADAVRTELQEAVADAEAEIPAEIPKAHEGASPSHVDGSADTLELRWNTRYEASKPRLAKRLKALMRISDEVELHQAERTIAAIQNLPEVGEYGGSVRIENRAAKRPGDSDFIYSLFVGDQGFQLSYHERVSMEGGQWDYTDVVTLVTCEPVGWETEDESADEEALANMRAVAEMMAGRSFDDEEWQMQVEAAREMEEASLPNGIEEWLEMLPVDDEGRCPKTVSIGWR